MTNLQNSWVLVTGAASGLGYEIAKRLLETEHANVVVVDRKPNVKTLFSHHGSSVFPILADLCREGAARDVFNKAVSGREIVAYINNAGATHFGPATKDNLDAYATMIKVNFMASVDLILLFADYFRDKGAGSILVVTSLGALVPMPYQNVYSATKHALHSFCEALQMELRSTLVHISILAPGGINTPMFEESGLLKHNNNKPPFHHLTPHRAARLAIDGLKKHRRLILPGFINKVAFLGFTVIPKWLTKRLIARTHRPK